jgi:hypothetical protein
MAFPQGIYFRATDDQVDPSNYDAEIYSAGSGGSNYPRTSSQGNSVGWESIVNNNLLTADRSSGSVVHLKGITYINNSSGVYANYRITLPATGSYRIRLALGDADNGQTIRARLYDDATEFADISGATGGGTENYLDATGVERTTQADWVSNNAYVDRTFASTIFRLRLGEHASASGSSTIAAIYIESLSGDTSAALDGSASTGAQTTPAVGTTVPL